MDGEWWRSVVGYEGFYEVSSRGHIRRAAVGQGTRGHCVLRPHAISRYGYLAVGLFQNGKRRSTLIHRIVAQAFLGNAPPDRPEVNHKDGNPRNNASANLEYATRSENMKDAVRRRGLWGAAAMMVALYGPR